MTRAFPLQSVVARIVIQQNVVGSAVVARAFLLQSVVARIVVQQNVVGSAVVARAFLLQSVVAQIVGTTKRRKLAQAADEFQPHWGLLWCPCDAFRKSNLTIYGDSLYQANCSRNSTRSVAIWGPQMV